MQGTSCKYFEPRERFPRISRNNPMQLGKYIIVNFRFVMIVNLKTKKLEIMCTSYPSSMRPFCLINTVI